MLRYASNFGKTVVARATSIFHSTMDVLRYRIDLGKALTPKQLRVHDYWLIAITRDAHGHLLLSERCTTREKRRCPVDGALVELRTQAAETSPGSDSIPVLCLHDLDPLPGGVRCLLLPSMPAKIEEQISSLGLSDTIAINAHAGPPRYGVIGSTLIDFGHERIIVLGNAKRFCDIANVIGRRFEFSANRSELVAQLRKLFVSQGIEPVGSRLVIGGLGTIFAFEAAFLITRMQGIDPGENTFLLISVILVFLSIVGFLVQEAFESRIAAFTPWWTLKPKLASWVVFIAFLVAAPISFFVPLDGMHVCHAVRYSGLALIVSCLMAAIGQIHFEAGLTKGMVLTWWLVLGGIILIAPVLDGLQL